MTRSQPLRRQRNGLGGLWLVIGLVIAVVLIAGSYWFLIRGPGSGLLSPAGTTVADFKGERNETTSNFTVRSGWRIDWQHDASFAFEIKGDRDFGTVINERDAGSGVTSPVGAGTFHLEISADGPWEVKIIQGD